MLISCFSERSFLSYFAVEFAVMLLRRINISLRQAHTSNIVIAWTKIVKKSFNLLIISDVLQSMISIGNFSLATEIYPVSAVFLWNFTSPGDKRYIWTMNRESDRFVGEVISRLIESDAFRWHRAPLNAREVYMWQSFRVPCACKMKSDDSKIHPVLFICSREFARYSVRDQ